jgi:hypothetical protein
MSIYLKRALVGAVAVLLTCLLSCLAYGIVMRAVNQIWLVGVEHAAQRVGAAPTLNGIAEYIVVSVRVGMSREQVEQILRVIAPIEVVRGTPDKVIDPGWGPAICDELWLKLTPLPGHEWRMFACYNQAGELVLLKSADPDFPPLGISAPIQR